MYVASEKLSNFDVNFGTMGGNCQTLEKVSGNGQIYYQKDQKPRSRIIKIFNMADYLRAVFEFPQRYIDLSGYIFDSNNLIYLSFLAYVLMLLFKRIFQT